MLEEMRRNVRDASLIVKNLFNQFDLHGRGCISAEQFLRVVSCHGLLSADKVRAQKCHGSSGLSQQNSLPERIFAIEKLQQLISDHCEQLTSP